MSTYSNQEAVEGTVTTTATITLTRKSRALEIINDSTVRDLEYRFNSAENYSTLRPLEAVSFDFITRTIYLNSPDSVAINYRIRVLG